jgi:hypothetical protein
VALGDLAGVLTDLQEVGTPYVAGSSTVELVGRLDAVDASVAKATIGDVTVDYSSRLVVEPTFAPLSGELIALSGIQPVAGGAILSSDVTRR